MYCQNINRHIVRAVTFSMGCLILFSAGEEVFAQAMGSRRSYSNPSSANLKLSPNEVSKYITVSATVRRRVKPERLRMIWAITASDSSAEKCMNQIEQKIQSVRKQWKELGVENKDVVEDFISAVPEYSWETSNEKGQAVLREVPSGFRTQFNLHVSVPDEKAATKVIKAALKLGVHNLIGVDYTAELQKVRDELMVQGMKEAKRKSNFLLSEVFSEKPKPINVNHKTQVHYPSSMYKTAYPRSASRVESNRKQLTRIYFPKPEHVYYQGLEHQADRRSYRLPMNPSIVVESTVTIYYQNPAAEGSKKESKKNEGEVK